VINHAIAAVLVAPFTSAFSGLRYNSSISSCFAIS
jgi:hypothetical protein